MEAEIEELRTRLREAQETLEAIRTGGVDSLVIGPQDSEQVYTLATADRPYRLIVAGMGEGAATLSDSGTVLYANPRLGVMVGRPAGDLVGGSVFDLTTRDGGDALRALLHIPPGGSTRGQLELRRADGSGVPVAVSVSGVDIDSMSVRCLVATDLTALRAAERELAVSQAARDEALAANRLKSQFVATVSHEIRTPMNGVIGLTDLLLGTPLNAAQRRYAEAIRDSGRALLAIINDILDFSKIEAGRVEIVDAGFELDELLDGAVQVAAEAAGRGKDLEVLGYYPPGLPTALRGDEGRLRQVLLNLLGNAVKFTEHGEVLLRADLATPAEDGRVRITFTIADTGIGIAGHHLGLLFEPFSQVDSTTSRRFGGTGLGLAICRQIIDLMGGHLEVRSRPGRGSRFFFTLPFRPHAGPSGQRRAAGGAFAGRRLLVVDDNPTYRQLLTDHCRAWGMVASAVPSGHAALARLRRAAQTRTPYEVVLVDQQMPGTSGADLAQLIRADPAIPAASTVLLTSGAHQDDEIAANAGATAILAKPVGPARLHDCLLRLCEEAGRGQDPPASGRAHRERGRVLLAEDHDINQLVAVETLATLGYQADVACDGEEAVELATTRSYQAILMDCQMPVMDGYAATAELRKREPPDRHVPIIAITAGAFAEDESRCRDAGMDDYLAKPIDADQLAAVLDRWTAAHTAHHPDAPA